jgi:hypothetical protein
MPSARRWQKQTTQRSRTLEPGTFTVPHPKQPAPRQAALSPDDDRIRNCSQNSTKVSHFAVIRHPGGREPQEVSEQSAKMMSLSKSAD